MVKRLAENTLKRAKLRQCHQQHVSGLSRAFKSDANLGPIHKAEQIARVDQLRDSVRARLDHLEQLSKELLQIVRQDPNSRALVISTDISTVQEFAWVSIREAGSIKRISIVTVSVECFFFLGLYG